MNIFAVLLASLLLLVPGKKTQRSQSARKRVVFRQQDMASASVSPRPLPPPPPPAKPKPEPKPKPATASSPLPVDEEKQLAALQFAQQKFWEGASTDKAIDIAVAEYKRLGGANVAKFTARAKKYPWATD